MKLINLPVLVLLLELPVHLRDLHLLPRLHLCQLLLQELEKKQNSIIWEFNVCEGK